jgi:hypothetical protein
MGDTLVSSRLINPARAPNRLKAAAWPTPGIKIRPSLLGGCKSTLKPLYASGRVVFYATFESPQQLILSKRFLLTAITMPHSVSPEDPASPDQGANTEESKAENVATQESEGTAIADSLGPIEESQASEDQDMTMADVVTVGEETPVKLEITAEVKL